MSLLDYYLAAFLPFTVVYFLLHLDIHYGFSISLLFYYLYRCILDYIKLEMQGTVTKKDIWKFVVPIHTFIYFKQLYFRP